MTFFLCNLQNPLLIQTNLTHPPPSAQENAQTQSRKTLSYKDIYEAVEIIQYGGGEDGVRGVREVLRVEVDGESFEGGVSGSGGQVLEVGGGAGGTRRLVVEGI